MSLIVPAALLTTLWFLRGGASSPLCARSRGGVGRPGVGIASKGTLVGARRLSIEARKELEELEGVSRRSEDGMRSLLAFAVRRGLGAADICGLATGLAW